MSTPGIPAQRIRLHMEGLPQEMSETIALALFEAVKFCARPETFPVFRAWAVKDNPGPYGEALARLPRAALTEIQVLLAAGALADLEALS